MSENCDWCATPITTVTEAIDRYAFDVVPTAPEPTVSLACSNTFCSRACAKAYVDAQQDLYE